IRTSRGAASDRWGWSLSGGRRPSGAAEGQATVEDAVAASGGIAEEDAEAGPRQLPDMTRDAEGEAERQRKPEGREDGDLAAFLRADLGGNDEEQPVHRDRQHLDGHRGDDRHRETE